MTQWTRDELDAIGAAEELEIRSVQADGTLRRPTIIWVVRVDRDLYIRSVDGRASHWFRGVQVRHEGHIRAGGVEKNVTFVDVDAHDDVHERIDAAYRAKYSGPLARWVPPTLTPQARDATVKLQPRA